MKRNKLAITTALVAALSLTPVLGACSGDKFDKIDFAAQDTSYAVTSQGGNAVGYGNYVYFINGTRGYDDTDGNANVWGSVVKGALYRAELNGAKNDGTPASFSPTPDSEAIEFKYSNGTDYFDAPVKNVNVTSIAPKTIGTSGYNNGGLFIYDNYAYFASPNNSKDKMGNVQTTRTDFFMMPLSGGKPTRIYTTTEGVDTSSAAYAFYKYGGKVYLVVNEGSSIISVGINVAKEKTDDPVSFNVGATSVYFPVRDEYYSGISTDTPEDFIYFVRAVDDDKDKLKTGTVIEAMRPDGSENFQVSMNGNTETIEAVRDGVVFIRSTDSASTSTTYMTYTNLHDMLMEKSPSYKAAQEAKGDSANRNVAGRFDAAINSAVTATYAIRPDKLSNTVYYIGVTGSAMRLYKTDGTFDSIADVTGTIQFVRNNHVYYSGSSSDYYRVPLWSNIDGFGEAQTLAETTTSSGAPCDYVDGYFTYYAEVDQWANAYTHFYKVDGIAGADPLFVGKRASFDIPSEDQIKEAKKDDTETESAE